MADNAPLVGKLIEGEARRDAIHVAVAPVVAACALRPGQRVGLVDDRATPDAEPIGIIDPYLEGDVPAGARCWLFLFPNTITSLRHVWTHPAFRAKSLEELARGERA
ncbi:MAG: hypothetical protein K2W96_26495 [Gemmataceae bacterium]|nr:hypothetical protein [Gemmataceae bacterium]